MEVQYKTLDALLEHGESEDEITKQLVILLEDGIEADELCDYLEAYMEDNFNEEEYIDMLGDLIAAMYGDCSTDHLLHPMNIRG